MGHVQVWEPKVNFAIYQIHNTVNGRYYVGSTKDPYARLYKHRWELQNGHHPATRLQQDWITFGENALVFEVLEEGVTDSQRFVREQHWADTKKAWPSGYNQQPNVETSIGAVRDAVARAKIAEATLRQFSREDARAKTSEATRKAMADEELRKRLSESAKRKWEDPVYREEMRKRRETGVPSEILAERSRAARKERERLRGQQRIHPKKIKPYHYEIAAPDGTKCLARDVRAFCVANGIWPSAAYGSIAGKNRGTKGFTFRRIELPFPEAIQLTRGEILAGE